MGICRFMFYNSPPRRAHVVGSIYTSLSVRKVLFAVSVSFSWCEAKRIEANPYEVNSPAAVASSPTIYLQPPNHGQPRGCRQSDHGSDSEYQSKRQSSQQCITFDEQRKCCQAVSSYTHCKGAGANH